MDHQPRKRGILVAADLISTAAIISVPVAQLAGLLSMPLLHASAALLGLGGVLRGTASQPFFVQLVVRRHYVQVNSLLSTTQSASGIVGLGTGGLLIAAVTARSP